MISLATAVAASALSWRAAGAYLTGVSAVAFQSGPIVRPTQRQSSRRRSAAAAAAASGIMMQSNTPTCFDASSSPKGTRNDPQLLEGGSTSRAEFLRMMASSTAAIACTAAVTAAGTPADAADNSVVRSGETWFY